MISRDAQAQIRAISLQVLGKRLYSTWTKQTFHTYVVYHEKIASVWFTLKTRNNIVHHLQKTHPPEQGKDVHWGD